VFEVMCKSACHFDDSFGCRSGQAPEGEIKRRIGSRSLALKVEHRFEQGSVAFWVRPIDWDNRTRWAQTSTSPRPKVSPVFQLNALHHDGSPLKFGPFMQLFMIRTPDANLANPVSLHPGIWTHICVTWGAGGRRTYVNGQRRDDSGAVGFAINRDGVKAAAPVHLAFGRTDTAFDFHPEEMGASACAVDDFRLYRRTLSPSEVRNLAVMFDRRTELKPLPAVDMTTRYNTARPGHVPHVVLRLPSRHEPRLAATQDATGRKATGLADWHERRLRSGPGAALLRRER